MTGGNSGVFETSLRDIVAFVACNHKQVRLMPGKVSDDVLGDIGISKNVTPLRIMTYVSQSQIEACQAYVNIS